MRVAVIPARGGSKRVPRKNIKDFCGKPMIAWSIEAAKKSGCFGRVVVSTDDVEIAKVALNYGAEVPFMRPAELADDFTGTVPVISHAVTWFKKNKINITEVCCLYATAPFVKAEDLLRGLDAMLTNKSEYAISVTTFPFPIQRSLRLDSENRIEMIYPENLNVRSQDLEECYHDAGQFYWGRASAWLSSKPLLSSLASTIILPRYRVQDIDTEEDWVRASYIFKALELAGEI
jgi:pseudaminic acid cytidylyltransferase